MKGSWSLDSSSLFGMPFVYDLDLKHKMAVILDSSSVSSLFNLL